MQVAKRNQSETGSEIKIILPPPPDVGGNARKNWRTALRDKKRYYNACDERQLLGLIPPPPAKPIAFCKITTHFRTHCTLDWDNICGRQKLPLDFLVTRGYLLDDSPKVIPVCPVVTQEIDRQNKQIEITITILSEK